MYGSYPGVEGLGSAADRVPQIDSAMGAPYKTLPEVDSNVPKTLPNAPFDITAYVRQNQKTVDLVHTFYLEQLQIDGGRMDAFVDVSDAKGLALGYYPTKNLPLANKLRSISKQVTIRDYFFHAAFGGSAPFADLDDRRRASRMRRRRCSRSLMHWGGGCWWMAR